MKTTTNHGFKKPDGTDTVNIEDLNYNADKLDALLVPATTTANGLMSKDDKTKLNGIAAGANKYTHPATHPVSMISGLQKVATSGSYNDLLNKPSTFPPSNHTHDDRYYTESEIDNKLKGVTEKINDCFKPKGDLTGSANTFVENGVGRDIGSMTELPSAFGNIITFNSDTGGGCYLTQLYANNNYLGYRFGADNNLKGSNWQQIATTTKTEYTLSLLSGFVAATYSQTKIIKDGCDNYTAYFGVVKSDGSDIPSGIYHIGSIVGSPQKFVQGYAIAYVSDSEFYTALCYINSSGIIMAHTEHKCKKIQGFVNWRSDL